MCDGYGVQQTIALQKKPKFPFDQMLFLFLFGSIFDTSINKTNRTHTFFSQLTHLRLMLTLQPPPPLTPHNHRTTTTIACRSKPRCHLGWLHYLQPNLEASQRPRPNPWPQRCGPTRAHWGRMVFHHQPLGQIPWTVCSMPIQIPMGHGVF